MMNDRKRIIFCLNIHFVIRFRKILNIGEWKLIKVLLQSIYFILRVLDTLLAGEQYKIIFSYFNWK